MRRQINRKSVAALPVRYSLRLVTATSLVTAVLLACAAVAGLLFGARGLYRSDPATLPAFLGQDAVTLVAVLPLLVWSAWAARRGSVRGLLLWAAALFYVAYSYAYYALNPEFNWLYLVYIAVVAMGLYGCLYLLFAIDAEAVARRFGKRTPVRTAGGFLMALPTLLGLAWVVMILAHLSSGQMPNRVNQVVWPMDLIVAFPAMFWGGLWLWRQQPLGYVVAAVLLVKGGLLGVTLVINTWITTTFWGGAMDPAVPAYAIGGLGGLALAVWYLRQLGPDVRAPAGALAASGPAGRPVAPGPDRRSQARRHPSTVACRLRQVLRNQQTLDRLLFARRIADRLREEEFRTGPPAVGEAVDTLEAQQHSAVC